MSQAVTTSTRGGRETSDRLAHFPVTFFAVIMGLMGYALATQATARIVPALAGVSQAVLIFGIACFSVISILYLFKWIRHPDAVRTEWSHPVKLAFFPAISISLLLMATALMAHHPAVARPVWIIGAIAQGGLTVSVLTGWISHRSFEMGHLTPGWFIPAVGNVIVPVAGVHLGYVEISWLFFSGGLVFWIVLLTLVFNRLVFHDPIPGRLFPTMVILIAPPAVAFVAYYNLEGQIDAFARILLNAVYVFALLVLTQFPKLMRLPFALSWWALSFPVAALSIASFVYARAEQSGAHQVIGFAGLAVLTAVLVGLIYRTFVAIRRGEVCRPE